MGINAELKQTIQEAIEMDRLTGQKLKDILLNGPRDAAKGLQELVLSQLRAKVPKKASNPFSYAIFGTFTLSRDNTTARRERSYYLALWACLLLY
jgi:hypothetical protein